MGEPLSASALAAIIGGSNIAGGLLQPGGDQEFESFGLIPVGGKNLSVKDLVGRNLGANARFGNALVDRAEDDINLRGAFVQQPQSFSGDALPFDIGLSGQDPALGDPSLLTSVGQTLGDPFGAFGINPAVISPPGADPEEPPGCDPNTGDNCNGGDETGGTDPSPIHERRPTQREPIIDAQQHGGGAAPSTVRRPTLDAGAPPSGGTGGGGGGSSPEHDQALGAMQLILQARQQTPQLGAQAGAGGPAQSDGIARAPATTTSATRTRTLAGAYTSADAWVAATANTVDTTPRTVRPDRH